MGFNLGFKGLIVDGLLSVNILAFLYQQQVLTFYSIYLCLAIQFRMGARVV